MTCAAERRDPISIQRLVVDRNDLGELNNEDPENWTVHTLQYGKVILQGTREFVKAGILNADVSHLIQVPKCTATMAITSEMRILLHATGQFLHIEGVTLPTAGGREVSILCRV